MAIVNFYHLSTLPIGKALPKLLEKIIVMDKKILINTSSQEKLEELDMQMWTYTTKFFLPHGIQGDGFEEEQPIFLTHKNDNKNNATILAMVENSLVDNLNDFEKSIYMFDGHDDNQVNLAREHWKKLSKEDHQLTYWQQNNKGGWENKHS